MNEKRRFGTEQSATRGVILDATERVMVEEGYAAITTRRVALAAGLKAPLVHYYFKTTEDLLIAVYRRSAEHSVQRHSEAMARGDILHALWDVNVEPYRTTLALEFLAMANHRKFIQEEISRYAEQIRAIQTVALDRFFQSRGLETGPVPSVVLAIIIAAVARLLVMEDGVGIRLGHAEARKVIEDYLVTLTQAQPATEGARRPGA